MTFGCGDEFDASAWAGLKILEGRFEGTNYRLLGSGAPIVLVHGVGADLEMWRPLAMRLANTQTVICYDMLGHGESNKPAGPYSLALFVEQLHRLTADLNFSQFDLLGFSMGGLVSQGFALTHPECVNRLILLNTVFDRSEKEREAVMHRVETSRKDGTAIVETALQRWFTPEFAAKNPDIVSCMRQRMIDNDRDAYASAYSVFATADQELAPVVNRITAPTLIVTGEFDSNSTPEMARNLAAKLVKGQAAILPNQRHMPPLEAPDELAKMVLDFLTQPLPDVVMEQPQ